ncbi:MAG: hypothetical protein EA425_08220 [Puniceicoccaceae bacterium]|nr:MAG: hypothetical protein EA425_08220 [Puniceicoccaceae bacterium]
MKGLIGSKTVLAGGTLILLIMALWLVVHLTSAPPSVPGEATEDRVAGSDAAVDAVADETVEVAAQPLESSGEDQPARATDAAALMAGFDWEDGSLEELAGLVKALERAGTPAPMIRRMVETLLRERVERDPQAFVAEFPIDPDAPWYPTRDHIQLTQQRKRIMHDLFGSWDYGWTEDDYERHRSTMGTIPVERMIDMDSITEFYFHQSRAALYRDPNDPAVVLWEVAVLDSLATVLSPEELIQFELNQRRYGIGLRNMVANRDYTLEELSRLLELERNQYLAMHGVTLPDVETSAAVVLSAQRELLGDDQVVEHLRSTNGLFEIYIERILDAEASADATRQLDVWLAKEAITDELKQLRSRYPDEQDYRQAIRDGNLIEEARSTMVEAGGESAWRRYQLSGFAGWLSMMERDEPSDP